MEHLKWFHGTQVCRGTPVEKHCSMASVNVKKGDVLKDDDDVTLMPVISMLIKGDSQKNEW